MANRYVAGDVDRGARPDRYPQSTAQGFTRSDRFYGELTGTCGRRASQPHANLGQGPSERRLRYCSQRRPA